MLTDILWAAFDPAGNTRSWWAERFPANLTDGEQSHEGIVCPPPSVASISELAWLSLGRNFDGKNKAIRVSNQQRQMSHNAVYLQSWAFVLAVILCSLWHRTWHFQVITGVSHYWQSELRLFSLDTGVCLKIKHHLITLWPSCGALRGCAPVCNFPAGHMGSCTPLRVALTALTTPRPIFLFDRRI